MRILIVSDVSSFMRGGVPSETRGLVQGLAGRGHSVALASHAPLSGGDAALHLPISVPITRALGQEITSALTRFRPDIVHVLGMSSKGVLQLAPLLSAQRWTLTVHSVPPYENKLQGWHRYESLHYALRALRYMPNALAWRYVFRSRTPPRVIVHSRVVEDIVVRHGYPGTCIDVIPLFFHAGATGAQASALRNPDAPLLLTVGGLTHTKGQHDVVAALPRLLQRFPRLRYQLVGEVRDESYLAELRRRARSLGIERQLIVSSNVTPSALATIRAGADVYVQPSHEEGFCLAYAEAAASIPRLVGTRTGAIAEMSQDDPGASVVPVRDPAALGRAIAVQLENELPIDHLQTRTRRLSALIGFAGYLDAHEAVYAKLALS